ncbi:hypothetical protein EJB05_02060, partial [Eragrostis curvula]
KTRIRHRSRKYVLDTRRIQIRHGYGSDTYPRSIRLKIIKRKIGYFSVRIGLYVAQHWIRISPATAHLRQIYPCLSSPPLPDLAATQNISRQGDDREEEEHDPLLHICPTAVELAGGDPTTISRARAPLWDHVNIVEKATSGGNTGWTCKYCNHNGFSSYTRVEAHLLLMNGKGINPCPKVTDEILAQMRSEVQKCKELVQRGKTRTVPMPTAPVSRDGTKNKRGPISTLEKSWALQDRKHLDALISRSFYSRGMPLCRVPRTRYPRLPI